MRDLFPLCREPLMRLRDVEKPRVSDMRTVTSEMHVEALQAHMQGMRIPTDEEEKVG